MLEKQLIISQIKAMTIFDANNTMMSVLECAKYLDVHFNTIKNRIEKKTIIAIFQDGKYHIPRLQFVDDLVQEFLNNTDNKLVNEDDVFAEKLDNYFKEKFITA